MKENLPIGEMTSRDIEDFYRTYKKTALAHVEIVDFNTKKVMKEMKVKDSGELNLKDPTPIEESMACGLSYYNIDYIHQYAFGPYIMDFAIITDKVKINLECDGREYHKTNEDQEAKDRKRDDYMINKGWLPVRFSGDQITKNFLFCAETVRKIIKGTT